MRDLFGRYGCDMTRMVVLECDLASFDSIHRCVAEFSAQEEKLDILVNNAGVMLYPRFEKTVDGHEMTWQSNYLGGFGGIEGGGSMGGTDWMVVTGHFLLTELLLQKLEKSEDGGRIVNQSSALHLNADTVDMEVCDSKAHFGRWMITYARSKLGNVSGGLFVGVMGKAGGEGYFKTPFQGFSKIFKTSTVPF